MKIDKTLFKIIAVCLIAEPFFIHLQNISVFILSKILHVKCVFHHFGFGTMCKVGNASGPTMVIHGSIIFFAFAFSLLGFIVSKKASAIKSVNLTLSGALLFYSAIHQTLYFAMINLRHNFIKYVFYGEPKDTRPLEYFGNYQNYELIYFVLSILFILIYIYLAYQIIFKMWEREFRIKIFTVGFISFLIGNIIWYAFLGKLIYSYFNLYFYS